MLALLPFMAMLVVFMDEMLLPVMDAMLLLFMEAMLTYMADCTELRAMRSRSRVSDGSLYRLLHVASPSVTRPLCRHTRPLCPPTRPLCGTDVCRC